MFHRSITFFYDFYLNFMPVQMLQDPYKRASHSHLCNPKPVILVQPLPCRWNDCFSGMRWGLSYAKQEHDISVSALRLLLALCHKFN